MDSTTMNPGFSGKVYSGGYNEKVTGLCLVCDNDHVASSSDKLSSPSRKRKLLDKVSHTIFIVLEVLEIPENLLAMHLKEGELGDASEWGLSFCEDCEGEIRECKEIYEELLEATRRYRDAKEEIIGKVKRSHDDRSRDEQILHERPHERSKRRKKKNVAGNCGNVREVCRDFVATNNYETVTVPFSRGDLRADKDELLTAPSASMMVKVEIDENFDDVEEPDHLFDVTTGAYSEKCEIAPTKRRRARQSVVEETVLLATRNKKGSVSRPPAQNMEDCDNNGGEQTTECMLQTSFVEKECGESETDLQHHKRTKRRTSLVQCDHCGNTFASKQTLKQHVRSHHKPELSSTEATPAKPRGRPMGSAVGRNLLNVATSGGVHYDAYTCSFCGKRFSSTGSKSNHEKRHKVHRFNCQLCPYTCIRMYELNRHLRTHRQQLSVD